MMKRLTEQGLVENAQGHTGYQVKAWRLTTHGEAAIDTHKSLQRAQRRAPRGATPATTASPAARGGRNQQVAATNTAFRLTLLTHEVLSAVATLSASDSSLSNRKIADAVAVKDDGQISKLLARLQNHGLLHNAGAPSPAAGNAWQITPRGEEILHATHAKEPTR
jgi:DNA-binding HxlR family transcriptional regulator